jgi:hypothetical protein
LDKPRPVTRSLHQNFSQYRCRNYDSCLLLFKFLKQNTKLYRVNTAFEKD